MDLNQRLNSFLQLGQYLQNIEKDALDDIIDSASYKNAWFTPENIKRSLQGLVKYLDELNLKEWLARYQLENINPKKIGVIMAGNIPMVGIHDMMCILLAGHKMKAKISSQDDVLIPAIAQILIDNNPAFSEYIEFVEQLKDIDAVIATGSDNSSRYFDYYFSKYPNVIRKNRTSIAVLSGDETNEELTALGDDIFSFFGLGCRNVSKIFLPEGSKIEEVINNFKHYQSLADHNKYANNYYYQKSIMLVNQTAHLDNGFALFVETDKLTSPISMIYYEYYSDLSELKKSIDLQKQKIQCIVSNIGFFENAITPGQAQKPAIWDYTDNIDTMQFLANL